MLNFKLYIEENAATKMPEPEYKEDGTLKTRTAKSFPKATINAIYRHPEFKKHIANSDIHAFANSVTKVIPDKPEYDHHVVHAVTGEQNGVRHRIDFHLAPSHRSVDSTNHFVNVNNEKDAKGNRVWRTYSDWVKSSKS